MARVNAERPTQQIQRPQQYQQTQPLRPTQQLQSQSQYRPSSSSSYQPQQSAPQRFQSGGYEETPRGVQTAAAASSRPQTGLSQSARFEQDMTVNDRPYYVAPYDAPPSHQFAPQARALGNKTYSFDTDSANYPFSQSFRGRPLESSRPLQDPGQSIPYGRLQAEDARDVRLKMSLDSWDTFNVYDRNGAVNYNLSGLKSKMSSKEDQSNFCKDSISKRLETGAQMRYHLPSYCGFVPTAQFRHGATYGKTTRLSLAGSQAGL